MSPTINPTDPVFLSYRQSDGTTITAELAWLLRAAGIPVWRDKDDLPPGDTTQRLGEAIAAGLSGGVLVVTPQVIDSEVVRKIEAPRLIALHEAEPDFALGIANSVERAPGGTDYEAPDRLLGLRPLTLAHTDQKPTTREGLLDLVRRLLWHRVSQQRESVAAAGSVFEISLQTRNSPQVYDRTGCQLDIRVRPSSHERLPDPDGLRDLAATIELLPDAVTRSGAAGVRVKGGAHLSVAFALGAALPSSRIGYLEVVDQRGDTWAGGGEAAVQEPPTLRIEAEHRIAVAPGARPKVAVYADLLPTPSPSAFDRFLEEHSAALTAWQVIVPAKPGLLSASDAGSIAGEMAARIRALSGANGNAEVHLLLRLPFPIAVLVGRLTNTVRSTLYEWDDSDPKLGSDSRPRYNPTLRIRASSTAGAIAEVLA